MVNRCGSDVLPFICIRVFSGGFKGGRSGRDAPRWLINFSISRLFPYKRHIVSCVHAFAINDDEADALSSALFSTACAEMLRRVCVCVCDIIFGIRFH